MIRWFSRKCEVGKKGIYIYIYYYIVFYFGGEKLLHKFKEIKGAYSKNRKKKEKRKEKVKNKSSVACFGLLETTNVGSHKIIPFFMLFDYKQQTLMLGL